MEKSIEEIWEHGFLKSDSLVAPKLNNLYNQKSNHIVEKLKRMFGVNHIYVIGLSLFHLVGAILLKVPFIGAGQFILFFVLTMISRSNMDKMKSIDQNKSSYDYLRSFDRWLRDSLATYTRFYQFFYPLYFLSLILEMAFSPVLVKRGGTVAEYIINDPDTYLMNGLPVFWIIPILLFLAASAYFGGDLFKLDLNIVYGRVLKKLDELLTDIEELRS